MIHPQTLARIVAEIIASPVTIVVHPDDAPEMRAAVIPIDSSPVIKENELQEPGIVTLFVGRNVPILDLGKV